MELVVVWVRVAASAHHAFTWSCCRVLRRFAHLINVDLLLDLLTTLQDAVCDNPRLKLDVFLRSVVSLFDTLQSCDMLIKLVRVSRPLVLGLSPFDSRAPQQPITIRKPSKTDADSSVAQHGII